MNNNIIQGIKRRLLQWVFNRYIRWRLEEFIAPEAALLVDHPPRPVPRWGNAGGYHSELYDVIARHRDSYSQTITNFFELTRSMSDIPEQSLAEAPEVPNWNNGFFDALDAVTLYSFLASRRPNLFLEIGSGNSTKFARRAIRDFHLETKIISIDPKPRAEVDDICDIVIRKPMEDVDPAIFGQLRQGDFLFFDGTHRTFTNSDCTVLFLEVLPRLQPGVVLQIHDIFLPYDYPPGWAEQYYSEQYLLAAYLLGGGGGLKILLPNAFVSRDPQMLEVTSKLWEHERMRRVGGLLGRTPYLGSSFWCEIENHERK